MKFLIILLFCVNAHALTVEEEQCENLCKKKSVSDDEIVGYSIDEEDRYKDVPAIKNSVSRCRCLIDKEIREQNKKDYDEDTKEWRKTIETDETEAGDPETLKELDEAKEGYDNENSN